VAEYLGAVEGLRKIGAPDAGEAWMDYRPRGVGPEHVPDLIRLAIDPEQFTGDPESTEVYGAIHAWRALAQLRAAEALEPLLGLLDYLNEEPDDWMSQDMPKVLASLGPAVLPRLAEFLADPGEGPYPRWTVGNAIVHLAQEHPELRGECVAVLTRQLARSSAGDEDPEVNGFLVSQLIDLKAVESAPVIERAFKAGNVDRFIVGDWEDVRYHLGLRPDRPVRPPVRQAQQQVRPSSPKARAEQRKRQRRKEGKHKRRKE
jgi:hypothetical protein